MLEYLQITWSIWLITLVFLLIGLKIPVIGMFLIQSAVVNIILLGIIGYVFYASVDSTSMMSAKNMLITVLTFNTDIPVFGFVLPVGGFLFLKLGLKAFI